MVSTEIPINRNKIIIPALRPEVLRRARLLERFDDLLDKKLVIVTAPAGYGKTTLLVNFVRQSEMPSCWLSLDDLDKDPQRFIAYLIAALAERFPNFGKRSNAILKTVTGFEQDSERLLSSLINEISDLIGEHFVLVMDDYHFVDIIPNIRDFFSRFISLVSENCHIIISSRRLPTLPDITLMVARQQVNGFDLEELAFRPDEIRSLFEKNYGVKLGNDSTEELVRQTEGWITGLHLSAVDGFPGIPDPSIAVLRANGASAARATGVNLSVYLDNQVLSRQSPELRQFLLQTSLFEEFNADLVQAVLGTGDWTNLLEKVKRNNLFVLPVGPKGKWLRYHHLFRDFLKELFHQESPEAANAILLRLADVYEERREWEKAYALVQQLGNPDDLAGLVERVGTTLLLSEHLITLQSWLDNIPEVLLEKRPVLLSLKGAFLCVLGDGRAAVPLLDRAIAIFKKRPNLPGLSLALVRRAAALRIVGNYSGAIQDADEALQLGKRSPKYKMEIAEAMRFKGLCLFRLGQVEQATRFLEKSLQRYEHLGETESVARLQMEMGMACRAAGNYTSAGQHYLKALAEWKRVNNLFSQANAMNNLAVMYHMEGEYELAVKTLEEGLACARQGGFRWQEAILLASLGDILSDMDEYDSAHLTYSTAMRIAQQVSYQFLVNYLLLVQVRLARLRSRFQEAHRILQEVHPMIQASTSYSELGLLYLESGCLALGEAKLPLALSELRRAFDQFQLGKLTEEAGWSRVWLAAAFAASGDEEAARSQLQSVQDAISQEMGDSPLVHMTRHAVPWLANLLANPDSAVLLNRVTQAGEGLPALRKRLRRMLKAAPLQTSRLTIQAIGKPQVRFTGKLVPLLQWHAASVRNLFFFFLLNPRPVSKDEIGETFWPDFNPDRLKLRFKNSLYQLRHALGQDVIIFENNLYSFNRHLDYEYDVEEFDNHLSQAKKTGGVEEKIVHLLAATKLWHGPYLQDVDATWAWPERQRLENACLDALRQLADLYHQKGEMESALEVCRRALEVNPCSEEFHRLSMHLHFVRGDRLAVIWQYHACRDALQSGLDVDPSEETQALYRRLIT